MREVGACRPTFASATFLVLTKVRSGSVGEISELIRVLHGSQALALSFRTM